MRKVTTPPAVRPSGPSDALLPQAVRFLAAGGLATACHYVLLVVLVEAGLLAPAPASAAGYAAAAVLNYHLRRRLVFRSRRRHRRLLPGYLAVAAGGFGLNAAVMALSTGPPALPYLPAQVVATGLVLAWNFAAHRLWTFRATTALPAPLAPTLVARRVDAGMPENRDGSGGDLFVALPVILVRQDRAQRDRAEARGHDQADG